MNLVPNTNQIPNNWLPIQLLIWLSITDLVTDYYTGYWLTDYKFLYWLPNWIQVNQLLIWLTILMPITDSVNDY